MLFPTVEYAVFFLVVLTIAWLLRRWLVPHKIFLLLASYVFYGFWSWRYVPLLFGVSLFAGLIARAIQRTDNKNRRRQWLAIGVTICLLVLVYYKYTSFILLSALGLWGLVGRTPVWNLPAPFLPLGISFFVFHAISLLADVYRGKLKIRLHILDALLYVAFFPQLIAGPILRASNFIPQLAKLRDAHAIRVNRAFLLILAGLFKKVILSNTLSTRLVEPVFSSPMDFHRGDVWLAIYGYAAQIYCDFSGYTDIATGCAMLLGYRFPRNFNAPIYGDRPARLLAALAHFAIELAARLPVHSAGRIRGGTARTYINLMITMLLGGLWHGAAWTFVMWGALQGFYLVVHRLWAATPVAAIQKLRSATWWPWVARLLMFHAVCVGWCFSARRPSALRAACSLSCAAEALSHSAAWPVVLCLVLGLFGQYAPRVWRRGLEATMSRLPMPVNGAAMALGIWIIEVLGPTGVAPFIYFQF